MKKYRRHPILLLGLALLLVIPTAGCGQPVTEVEEDSAYTPEELRQIEEHEFFELYHRMKGYITHAQGIAARIRNYDWYCVGSVGWYEVDEYGVQRWTLLPDVLPSVEAAVPLVAVCDECYALAIKVWHESPYKEPQTVVQEIEKPSIAEWRGRCGQLKSALREAQVQTLLLDETAGKLFTKIQAVFDNSPAGMKEHYLGAFRNGAAEYAGLLDDLVYNLAEAERAESSLADWSFACLQAPPSSPRSTLSEPATESPEGEQPSQGWSPPEYLPPCFSKKPDPGWGGFW